MQDFFGACYVKTNYQISAGWIIWSSVTSSLSCQVRRLTRRWRLRWRVLEERQRTQRSLKERRAPTASASSLRRWDLTLSTSNTGASTSLGAPSSSPWGPWEREGPTRSEQEALDWTAEWQESQVGCRINICSLSLLLSLWTNFFLLLL